MADAESAVEKAVGFLQKTSSATGGSLFDHLSDIVSTVRSPSSPCARTPSAIQILKERPHEALDVLETSYILKRAQRRGEDAPVPEYANAVPLRRLRILARCRVPLERRPCSPHGGLSRSPKVHER